MRSLCPLNYGLELFGDRWTLLIIRDMMFFDKHYYNEFLSSTEGISTNILADRLALLEREGFIVKQKDKTHRQKPVYYLTPRGLSLKPVLLTVMKWSLDDTESGSLYQHVTLNKLP